MTSLTSLIEALEPALQARLGVLDAPHRCAVRLFNGFLEGWPDLVVDLYARTLVIFNYADPSQAAQDEFQQAVTFYRERLPWLQAGVIKHRRSPDRRMRCGMLAFGAAPDRRIYENGVWYALDLLMNQDASFYLDTRNLRIWAKEHLRGKRVLNTFAYTGSLGVAALAGGAEAVFQLDRSRIYLNLAKDSYALNSFPVVRSNFLTGEFHPLLARLKRAGGLFDCVFLDPPFFSEGGKGTVDLVTQSERVINKARPLVADGGWLVAVNNALFVSGADFLHLLEALGAQGFLRIETLIPVPEDVAGFPQTRVGLQPADPAPFNHSTKIAVLRLQRKDQRV